MFDSGIGGLSILRTLRAELPHEDFVYIADSGYAPYGERDAAHVITRSSAMELGKLAISQGMKTLRLVALEKAREGTSTLEQVLVATSSY